MARKIQTRCGIRLRGEYRLAEVKRVCREFLREHGLPEHEWRGDDLFLEENAKKKRDRSADRVERAAQEIERGSQG